MAPQKTLEEAGQKTLADLNLTVLDSKRTTVNGFPAIAAISQQVSQNRQTGAQQIIKVMSYLIEYNKSILVFHGDKLLLFASIKNTISKIKSISFKDPISGNQRSMNSQISLNI